MITGTEHHMQLERRACRLARDRCEVIDTENGKFSTYRHMRGRLSLYTLNTPLTPVLVRYDRTWRSLWDKMEDELTEQWFSADYIAAHLDITKDPVYKWFTEKNLLANRISRPLEIPNDRDRRSSPPRWCDG